MNSARLEYLFELLKETPEDPFLIYGIALEYRKTQPEKALAYFEQLLETHPDYLPTYYQAAGLYAEMNKRAEADKTYMKGLEISTKQANHHAYKELRSAYSNFQFDEEE